MTSKRSEPRIAGIALLPLIAGAFLILFAITTTWLIHDNTERVRLVEHTQQVQGAISDVQVVFYATESGVRRYLLTGEPTLRSTAANAVKALNRRLTRLGALVSDNPPQVKTVQDIRQVGQVRLQQLLVAVEAKAKGHDKAALTVLTQQAALAPMKDFRDLVALMRQREDDLLAQRSHLAERSRIALLAFSILTGLSTLIFSLVWMGNAARANRSLRQAYADLSRAHEDLRQEAASRVEAESQLLQMQKMDAIGQLTGGIAHDFNNMLAVIIGNLNLMERRLAKGDTDVGQFAASALDGAKRAATLTSRLLAFSRQQPLSPQPVDLNKQTLNLSEILRRTLGEGIQVETVQGAGLWRCKVDGAQLESAILNLALNARDAMNGVGKLTIETANAHLDEDYARRSGVTPGQYVMIAVTDTGAGMQPEVAERAFEPFFTTKPTGKGTGLGLSQVYGFIKQTQGHVKIYSEPDHGTTIKIYLPRLQGDEAAAIEDSKPALAGLTGQADEIVMVVEDEDRVRQFAVDALRELGYTVVHANGAAEAISKLQAQPKVSLLLTDIIMPDRNGKLLANDVQKMIPDLPVLFMTGFSRNAVVHNGLLDPGVNFLAKPFTLDQLGAKVREVLDASA